MATISDVKTSLSDMSDEDLRNILLRIRANRRDSVSRKRSETKKAQSKTQKDTAKKNISTLTPKEAQDLLDLLAVKGIL